MTEIQGLPGARGQALLPAAVLSRRDVAPRRREVDDPEAEVERFQTVRRGYAEELDALYEKTLAETGDGAADIIKAYAVIARDDFFFKKALRQVRAGGINADYALALERDKVCEKFAAMEDPYMKARADDIRNVCGELIRRMNGVSPDIRLSGDAPVILVAEDLTPEDTIRIDKRRLGGFVTERGGVTSHAVILAKTLGIPAVVGAAGILEAAGSGCELYLDGGAGRAVADPDAATREAFLTAKEREETQRALWAAAARERAVTRDGHAVAVCVNSGDTESLKAYDSQICDGIGLFRTEFLFMDQKDYPDEELQYAAYRSAAEAARGKEVIIRTLDIGGDKQLGYMDLPQENNPFLGYRAIRLCLDRKEIFRTQLRAILRASAHGNLKIMFPMIVTLEELREAKALAARALAELDAEGLPHAERVPMGIMVETPAAVLLSDVLAREADFFSIGTNDLIQYTTATDRQNERVQYLYDPCNLSVLRSIHMVIQNGHAAGITVGMCGEAASDDRLVPLLLGMGLDEFSVVPAQVGKVKHMVRSADFAALAPLVEELLSQREIAGAKALLERY